MTLEFNTSYLKDTTELLRYYKRLAERAIEQVPDENLFATPDAESNSIAIIVKHMAGNMRSRWTDFLTTDGEKTTRHRDTEFEAPPKTREQMMRVWDEGWQRLFSALSNLSEEDMNRTVTIRNEPHSVMQAINRQIAHYSYHVGQIVFLARHYAGGQWKSLTVPRGQSEQFTAKVSSGELSQR